MIRPAVVSLFSGIGGIDLAFQQAGFEIIWANESDKSACITYRNNFDENILIEADILTVNEKKIPKADVLIAGFPCQSFSIMGYQRGFKDARGNLFFEIARVAEEIKPRIIFLENVKNLIYHDDGRTFITIFNTLAELGYCVKYDIENACTHGNIPQDRSRTFIVAFSDYDMLREFKFPEEVALTTTIDDIINRSIGRDNRYYYNVDSKYYPSLNKNIPDKTGIYQSNIIGVYREKKFMDA